MTAKARATATAPAAVIVAPPSTAHVVRISKSDIETKLQALGPGLQQAEVDAAALQPHVDGWSGYTDAQKIAAMGDALPMVQRLIGDVAALAVAVSDLVGALQVLPNA